MNTLVFLTAAAHIVYTPYTKVEESFNLQAMHDILYLRHNFSQYDHHEFSGVVPRTFLGPLFISILSTPFVLLFETLSINKFWAQYVVRLMLAGVVTAAWHNLRRVVIRMFGTDVGLWFTIITLTQFHFMFYMSRPLPNIMVLPIVLYALTYWLNGQRKHFIICSGIAILAFRFELVIFLGLLLLLDLFFKRITVDNLLKIAVPAGLVILATTIVVDSFFWQRFVWPEGEVLWYNTIMNKSSNWGTSPFLWYFYSALPRAMGASLLFVPVGIYLEPRIRSVVLAALGFVLIYSILPHKELRFIIYVFPVLNLAAACACHRFWINSGKSLWHSLLGFCAGGHLLLNAFITLFLLIISGTNYPGGVALTRLHRLEAHTTNISVHISNLAAQSGVSRFMQFREDWRYCKKEGLNYTREETMEYTHLLLEAKNKHNVELWATLQQDFEPVEYVDCFNSIGIQYNSLLPVRVKTKACISVLKRRDISLIPTESRIFEAKKRVEKAVSKVELAKKVKVEDEMEEPKTDDLASESETLETQTDKRSAESKSNEKAVDTQTDYRSAFAAISSSEAMNDGVVETMEEASLEFESAADEEVAHAKEINFQELRNLALGEASKKTKATKQKIRKLIIQHYRSKGRHIENDSLEKHEHLSTDKRHSPAVGGSGTGARQTVKSIIKQERIKEMIEQIATMDLTRMCDLEHTSTKDCLKHVIDKLDEDAIKT